MIILKEEKNRKELRQSREKSSVKKEGELRICLAKVGKKRENRD
jgi:hypothetical protein